MTDAKIKNQKLPYGLNADEAKSFSSWEVQTAQMISSLQELQGKKRQAIIRKYLKSALLSPNSLSQSSKKKLWLLSMTDCERSQLVL